MRFKERKDEPDKTEDAFGHDFNKFNKAELYLDRPREAELGDDEPLNTKYRRED
jgi:hypothetical protein